MRTASLITDALNLCISFVPTCQVNDLGVCRCVSVFKRSDKIMYQVNVRHCQLHAVHLRLYLVSVNHEKLFAFVQCHA